MATLLLLCSGCFDTHPYDVDFDGETGINSRQMAAIEKSCTGKDTLRVAFISDTHLWYAQTRDEVEALNRCGNIDFVIHCGDITYTGAAKEYEWCRDILAQLHCPYVALIGNHDFIGTGDEAYEAMYGSKDFAFIAASVKFICLNTNATEYDDTTSVPDLCFLEAEATGTTGDRHHGQFQPQRRCHACPTLQRPVYQQRHGIPQLPRPTAKSAMLRLWSPPLRRGRRYSGRWSDVLRHRLRRTP